MYRLAIPLLLIASPAAAQQRFQDTRLIDTAVGQFTGKAIGEDGGATAAVDTRLKLASCAMPQFEWRSDAHDAVVVRCMAPVWKIFVPVQGAKAAPRAVLAASAPVPIAKPEIVIKRGDPIVVEAGSPGFSISRDGIAMGDAAVGARVLVKIDDKKPPIHAIAVEAGHATLPGWAE
ncbi:flagella basal body P-ring formation protein FlgA [Sphingomonas japonica]|uniref:Flagella basal body P-ring formation protein FlgA n=1 Tax=Sphingomonas japonica TaxID=511662 RepID=A0ABX0U2P1_9SPHN|nr:flagella basal body P-ring formation protein FlgA [Sphingomonas japonica]NIJ23989.1 flagella basal body P-ring formation protein FlgA [Sphingomonas japonica]